MPSTRRLRPVSATHHYANARYNLARALAKSGKFDDAAGHFTALVTADPSDAQVCNAYGELLLKVNRPADGLAQLDKALELEPKNKTYWENWNLARSRLSPENENP